jgi:hypothetical protein
VTLQSISAQTDLSHERCAAKLVLSVAIVARSSGQPDACGFAALDDWFWLDDGMFVTQQS